MAALIMVKVKTPIKYSGNLCMIQTCHYAFQSHIPENVFLQNVATNLDISL